MATQPKMVDGSDGSSESCGQGEKAMTARMESVAGPAIWESTRLPAATHQEHDERRDGAADARAHGGRAQRRIPHHRGEELRRVVVDDGERAGNEELAEHDDGRGQGAVRLRVDKGRVDASDAAQHHEGGDQVAPAQSVHEDAGKDVARHVHHARDEED